MVVPPGEASVIVPTPSWLGSALHSDVADSVPALLKSSCEACDAGDELLAGAGEDRNLVVGVLHDVDVHQLGELGDVLVALILERRRGAVGAEAPSSCWLIWAICCNAVFAVCTPSAMPCSAWVRSCWMVVVIELRFCASACAAPITAVWSEYEPGLVDSACNAAGEIVVDRVERGRRSRRAVDLLELLIELRGGVGVGVAGSFRPQLALQQRVEIAIDAGDVDAGAGLAGGGDLDLIGALVDIAGRVGVRHVAGDHREALLGRIDARQGRRITPGKGPLLLAVHAAYRLRSEKPAPRITG